MELKFVSMDSTFVWMELLIVLNGIEILESLLFPWILETFNRTKWNWNSKRNFTMKGGQAFNRTKWNWNKFHIDGLERSHWLLIVLNGIEMLESSFAYGLWNAFNRTKWNWNIAESNCVDTRMSFNRTKWNWNKWKTALSLRMGRPFNRTKWNWNLISLHLSLNLL